MADILNQTITLCPKCNAKYDTARLMFGKKIKCKHCQTIVTVGQAVELVDKLLEVAIGEGASDIHIEPLADRLRVRFRIDGILAQRTEIDRELQAKILSRVKLLSDADIAEKRVHQDGRFQIRLGGDDVDVRMSSYVTVHGENIVLRILNKRMGLMPLDSLGVPPRLLKMYVDHALTAATGIIIITGPTGSGKTTTLYGSVAHVNSPDIKISTVEDPVEYQIDGVMQCAVNEKIGLTFTESIKALVRQDPDIVVLGEIRDVESASAATEIALTGHQVFSTFHTEDAVGALLRLMEMGIEPYLITSTITCVVGQRLARRICPHCAAPVDADARSLEILGIDPAMVAGRKFRRGRGCDRCQGTGFSGRIGFYEFLFLDDLIRQAVLERRPSYEIRNLALAGGSYMTLKEAGITCALAGKTTLEEVWNHAPRGGAPRAPAELFALSGETDPNA